MANALFEKGRQGFLEGSIAYLTDTIKAILMDLDTADTGVKAITGATNATPIVITATAHGFTNGDIVSIQGVGGNANANGKFRIANQATNTFELQNYDTGANIAGSGAYTSGGTVVNLSKQYLVDFDGGRVGTDQTLGTKTSTNGVADAADLTYTGVSGATIEAIGIYKDTGSAATSPMIALITSATGLPLTPNSGDIVVQWDNTAGLLIFKL